MLVAANVTSLGAGDAASGTLSERVEHGTGEMYELTVTVRDAAGNEASERTTLVATRRYGEWSRPSVSLDAADGVTHRLPRDSSAKSDCFPPSV